MPLSARIIGGAAVLAGLCGATAWAGDVCAPLQGTAAHTHCVTDQLKQARTPPDETRQTPSATPPAPYLGPDGVLTTPDPNESLATRGQKERAQILRNSTVRSNLLRQNIQRDLRPQVPRASPFPSSADPFGARPGSP